MLIYLQAIDPLPIAIGIIFFSTHSYGYASQKELRLENQVPKRGFSNFNSEHLQLILTDVFKSLHYNKLNLLYHLIVSCYNLYIRITTR